jgi:capsular exopolysaccharide synthesis family protein
MTTLPNTAPIRLPRQTSAGELLGPNGNGHVTALAPLAPHAAFPVPHPGAGGAQLTPGDVWRVVRSNLWLIILSLLVSAGAGVAVNQYILKPYYSRYTSTALCKVSTDAIKQGSFDNIAREVSTPAVEQEANNQASMLRHESLLIDVLSDPNNKIRQTKWWLECGTVEKAKEELMDHFAVSPIPDSGLISVSMEYKVPDDCRTIVQEIVTQHIKKERIRKNDDYDKSSRPTRQRKSDLSYELESLRRRILEKAGSSGQGSASATEAKRTEIARLIEERLKVSRDLAEARNKLSNLKNLNESGQDPPGFEEKISEDATYNKYRQAMDEMSLDLETKPFGSEHPQAQRTRTRMESLKQKLDDVREEKKNAMFSSLNAQYLADVETNEKMLKDVKEQITRAEGEFARSDAERQDLASLNAQEETLSKQYMEASSDLSKMEIAASQADFTNIDWARYPSVPDVPSFPKLSISLTVAIMLGLALSLGIAFLRELTDNTVRSPKDIARVGQLNLLGVLPHENDDPESTGARLPLVIFDAPHSMLAEQFRQLRSRLQYAANLDTTRSLLVTSAGGGDGKTVVATNLAAGLALNGRRILLVDANFRRPELHNVFGVGNETGFSDVLNSLDAFEQCVLESTVPNLSVLPSGQRPANPTELLESQLLIDFIDRALEEYDHVIFDTGPLPLVSETIALAPRVDGVVTVVRASRNSRGLLQRVRDMLRQVKAEHIGVVLNAVRAQAGGYYGRNILDYYKYQNGAAVNGRH